MSSSSSSSSSPPDDLAADDAPSSSSSASPPLLLSIPDDVLGLISASLRPSDLCSLMLSCRPLHSALSSSDKVWLHQCLRLSSPFIPPPLLHRWRDALPSYRALCRFLSAVSPLLGVWVHQNPELGNVVCVVPGFLSVVACRIIPQELGPLGLHLSPLLYTPVFEILAAPDGSVAAFFLHGRDAAEDSLYPGSVASIGAGGGSCNVLFLEVEEPLAAPLRQPQHKESQKSKSCVPSSSSDSPPSAVRRLCRSDTTIPRLPPVPPAPFARLAFGERRKLLELVAGKVRLKVPPGIANAPLFPQFSCGQDAAVLRERWESLLQLHKAGWGCVDRREVKLALDLIDHGGRSSLDCMDGVGGDDGLCSRSNSATGKRRSLASSMGGYLKQILGKGSSGNCGPSSSTSSGGSKHVQLQEFLRPRDAIGLSLRASNVKLTTYRAWPNIQDNKFALYKLRVQTPSAGKEFAGLWGGTFGWPPGQASEDKPGKALFFLLLSYEESEGNLHLIATKILEGTHYVLHPNGSAMFIVKIDEPSPEPFPWDVDGDCQPVEVKQSYGGEGIANGYGFRYPGSKPGSLYIMQNGLLAFVWTESKAVLTLQRLDLQELLKKGERVPAPPPIANFVYLTKSYSNVFAGFANNSNSSPAPRSHH